MVDYWRDTIVVFGRDGSLRRELGGPGNEKGRFSSPAGIALATDGSIFVADFYGHRIQQLSADGTFVRQWGVTGEASSGAGMFSYPSDVALAPDGSIIIADGYNDRVQVFKPDGQFLNKWGGPFAANIHGPFNGWFATVTSVAVDRDGTIFAADFYNNRIQKFSPDGRFLTSFGSIGQAKGEMRHPYGVAVANDGTVFVTDFGNNRVQIWRPAS